MIIFCSESFISYTNLYSPTLQRCKLSFPLSLTIPENRGFAISFLIVLAIRSCNFEDSFLNYLAAEDLKLTL